MSGFLDDLEALGRVGKALAKRVLDDVPAQDATANQPALYFDCVCARRWTFDLRRFTPSDALAWIQGHVAECPKARTWLESTRQLGSGA